MESKSLPLLNIQMMEQGRPEAVAKDLKTDIPDTTLIAHNELKFVLLEEE